MMNESQPRTRRSGNELEVRIGREIRTIGIPPRPEILTRIEVEMGKEEPDIRLLAHAISADVGLAASVVKVANSPFFGFGRKVRSVHEALMVLGLKTMTHAIAGIALQKMFAHVPNLERFWDFAAHAARVSAWLAQRLQTSPELRHDDAYTFGLFRDCGIAILLIPFPAYRDVLKKANDEPKDLFTAVEDRHLSINHAVVGAELAQEWLLPAETCQAIRHHHEIAAIEGSGAEPLPLGVRQLIALTQTAEHLIQKHSGMSWTREWDKLGDACMGTLGISPDDLVALENEVGAVIASGD